MYNSMIKAISLVAVILLFFWVRFGPFRNYPYTFSDGMLEATDAVYVAKSGKLPNIQVPADFQLLPNQIKQHPVRV